MDKQKQNLIDELMKDIAVRMDMAKGVAGSMNKGVEGWLSEYLIDRGWKKVKANEVVRQIDESQMADWMDGYKVGFRDGVIAMQIQAKNKIDEICKELTEG